MVLARSAIGDARHDSKVAFRDEVTRELREGWMRTEGKSLIEAARGEDANVG
ncbi:MAG: hypothetical protein JWO26_2822 [Rhodospirillales bacterium]|jgi:hypothetical protein|nr:hypothetical protein [Rhodospirillales bacterium]